MNTMADPIQENEFQRSNFSRLEEELAGSEPDWLHGLRQDSFTHFCEVGFPTTHDEEWKYTRVTPIAQTAFELAPRGADAGMTDYMRQFEFEDTSCIQLVFVNGHYSHGLSRIRPLPRGAHVGNLLETLVTHPEWVEPCLGRYATFPKRAFTALNTGFIHDGAMVRLCSGCEVEDLIHCIFVSTSPARPQISHPRNLILLGAHSRAGIVESYVGSSGHAYFTNAVTEVVVGEGASLNHCKLQHESDRAFHVASLHIHQQGGSAVSSHSISLGAVLARHDVDVTLDAEGSQCVLNGLYMTAGQQHVDHHTRIHHCKPRCVSHELYKGILDGKSTGVFNGKILVKQDAQKTDARQTNQNLLLSDDAGINTKPQLEIFADDVKCTHGATVGQLDEDAVFYLRSRGIGEASARGLLTRAFASDIIQRIGIEPVQSHLDHWLSKHPPHGEEEAR